MNGSAYEYKTDSYTIVKCQFKHIELEVSVPPVSRIFSRLLTWEWSGGFWWMVVAYLEAGHHFLPADAIVGAVA